MPHTARTYHLIAELLSTMQAEGYPLGTGQQLQVQELLRKLPEDTAPEELPYLLAPLFASSPKEQAHFYELFEQCRRRTGAFYKEVEAEEAPAAPDHHERRFRGIIWVLALLLLIPPAIVLFQVRKPVERGFIEKPFEVQAGGQAVLCLVDSTDLRELGRPEKYEVLYPGREGLGTFLVDTPNCLVYIAQDSISGQDSIVLEWSNAGGQKLQVHYKPVIVLPTVDTSRADTIIVDSQGPPPAFNLMAFPFSHDPLKYAVQPPSRLRQFLADNFVWLKWGGLLLFTALLLAVLFYRAYRRRKLVAELESKDKPPYAWNIRIEGAESINFGEGFGFILNLIRQRTGSEAYKLDVPKTIGATIEQGGMPAFRFQQQTQPPEYLLLVEQQSARNHRARLLDLLFRAFQANEVHIERFFFDSDLRVCYNELHPDGLPLLDIQQRYAGARLIVAGHGNGLLSKLSGKPEPWSRLLRNWKHRLLLSPNPIRNWGKRERRLGELFTVLPLSLQGLHFWLEELEMAEDARFDTWPERVKDAPLEPIEIHGALVPSLQPHFDGPMLQWIAACAVYPTLHWDLTLYLGQQLSIGRENLLSFDNMLQLTRLPWFVEGRIPPAARAGLVSWLEAANPALLEKVRTQLAEILRQNPPPADSAAFEDYRMNVALNEWLTTRKGSRKKELEKEISRLMEAGAEADVTVIKQLKRERHPLDFIVPDEWKKYLYPHGLPGLGWRGEWRDVMRWALPLWLPALLITAWPWQIRPAECAGPLVDYRLEGESALLCLDDALGLAAMLEAHAKAAVAWDSLPAATGRNLRFMDWLESGGGEFQLPLSAYTNEASWAWRTGQIKSWDGAKVEISGNAFSVSGPGQTAIPDSWQAEYRSNMAVAFYNKGVDLYLSGSQFYGQSPAEREAQLREGLEAWKQIKAGVSELPPDVQQSMLNTFERLGLRETSQLAPGQAALDSLIIRFEQLLGTGRERVCAYFREAIRLDSSHLDMGRIRAWCAGDVAADSIPREVCFRIAAASGEIALRSRQLSRQEADELNANFGKPGWLELRVNRQTLVKSISPGEEVWLLEEGADYYRVRHKGVEGYIIKTYRGRSTLEPCYAQTKADSASVLTQPETPAEETELQKLLAQAPESWDVLRKKANLSWEASGTTFPEIGVRGRYAILKPLLNPAVLEKIFGQKVYRSGPHRGSNIDYRNEEAFGYYNSAFLRKLYATLSKLSGNRRLTGQLQGIYNREFRDILRVFYLAYPQAANQKDIQGEFLSILNTPAAKRERFALSMYFNNRFAGFAGEIAKQGYDQLEGHMAARFWVRRSVDGTAGEFYRLLQLALYTFDPGFVAREIPAKQLRIDPGLLKLERVPTTQQGGNLKPATVNPTLQQAVPRLHTPRYLWCLDNPHGRNSPGKRSPVFDDGKTQLFEGELSRDVVQRIVRRLEEIGVQYYLVVPEEEDIDLRVRAERINNFQSSLPKLAVAVHFNAAPTTKLEEPWTAERNRGIEIWFQAGSRQSERLGAVFLEKIINKTGLNNRFLKSIQEGMTDLYLLRYVRTPIILPENGFYNNRADAALLAQPAFRQRLAEAYVEAILEIEAKGLEDTPALLIDEKDSDGDGVENSNDGCPFAPGPADNNGCPVEYVPEQAPLKSKNK